MEYLKKYDIEPSFEELIEEYTYPSVIEISTDNILYNRLNELIYRDSYDKNDYLSIHCLSEGEFTYAGSNLEYNKNNEGWISYTEPVQCVAEDVIKLRGNNATYNGVYIKYSGYFVLYGNTDSLINSNFNVSSYSSNVFRNTFRDNPTLLSIKYLTINATSQYCCYQMFYNCSKLLDVLDYLPKPSSDYAFYGMFNNCSNISDASNLIINLYGSYCCCSMFNNCTNLKTLPKLNMTQPYGSCCSSMFANCTSLTKAYDTLPIWSGYNSCYSYMFENCTNLSKPTKLIGTLANSACEAMFKNTAIESLPDDYFDEIKFNSSYSGGLRQMFSSCTKLKKIPDIVIDSSAGSYTFEYMFAYCTNLKEGPSVNVKNSGNVCRYMFQNCSNLKSATIDVSFPNSSYLSGMFGGCSSLKILHFYTVCPGDTQIDLGITSENGTLYKTQYSEFVLPDTWKTVDVSLNEVSDGWTVTDFPENPTGQQVYDWYNNVRFHLGNYFYVKYSNGELKYNQFMTNESGGTWSTTYGWHPTYNTIHVEARKSIDSEGQITYDEPSSYIPICVYKEFDHYMKNISSIYKHNSSINKTTFIDTEIPLGNSTKTIRSYISLYEIQETTASIYGIIPENSVDNMLSLQIKDGYIWGMGIDETEKIKVSSYTDFDIISVINSSSDGIVYITTYLRNSSTGELLIRERLYRGVTYGNNVYIGNIFEEEAEIDSNYAYMNFKIFDGYIDHIYNRLTYSY